MIVVLGGAGVGLGIYYGIFHPDAIKKPRDMSRDIILDGYTESNWVELNLFGRYEVTFHKLNSS